jgi:dipeptidyl aminopeptidase/acylaminoacyl peptidase
MKPVAPKNPRFPIAPVLVAFLGLLSALAVPGPQILAQSPEWIHQEGYLTPPDEIARVVTAPRHESVTLSNLSPDGRVFLNAVGGGLPSLADLSREYIRLAGLEVDPVASRHRNLSVGGSVRLELIGAGDGRVTRVQVPEGARVSATAWSPDGSHLAFVANRPGESHVYVADTGSGQSRRVTSAPLLATRVTAPEWSGDGRYLFAVVITEDRAREPRRPDVPSTPMVRVTTDEENRLRTYPSLLRDPHDGALLEHHTTGRLVRIEVASGQVRPIGGPAMFESISPAPGGEHIRVRTTRKPFSYIVPVSLFGDADQVWDLDGNVLVELEQRDVRAGVQNGDDGNDEPERRQLRWRPDGAGLSFLEREPAPEADEGEDEGEEESRTRNDRVMQWLAPFGEDDVRVVFESENQIRSLEYGPEAATLFITERVQGTETLYAVDPDEPEIRHVIYEWDTDEWYANPGSLLITDNAMGQRVVRTSPDGSHVYLSGTEFFEDPLEQAPRPFMDRVRLLEGETERVFQSREDVFERVTAVLDDEFRRIVIHRESPTMVPDSWLLTVGSGELRQLTRNRDPHPEITNARREILDVTRPDGATFRVQVVLPPDYREGTRLPAMLWFYPREYESEESYHESLRTHNKNRFPTIGARSMEILTRWGYAVVLHDHPIIGPPESWNNNYVVDLRANLLTVIDEVAERGWIDRRRLGLGGHSYGGFGTINAMVQTPYFRAGIAGAPNSNRLLTPIGFQRERRVLWEARETYLEMSPFLWAERLSGALLIYHGDDDQNVGTFPDNSWRLIHALNGLGKTAALYMYPYEGHGQRARETLLDMWARWIVWLDHYVKDADPTDPVTPIPTVVDDVDGAERPEGG